MGMGVLQGCCWEDVGDWAGRYGGVAELGSLSSTMVTWPELVAVKTQ